MPDLGDSQNLYLILAFIVPGLIILYIRSQFLTGRLPPLKESLLVFFTISAIYYGAILPFWDWFVTDLETRLGTLLLWFGFVFLGPVLIGLLLGIDAKRETSRRLLLRILGFNVTHSIPTAWDWKFANMEEQWVLVTLKDGSKIAGWCGIDSFMSSDPSERDLYIEYIYDLDENDNWIETEDKSVLISPGEISTIEFWPVHPMEGLRGKGS